MLNQDGNVVSFNNEVGLHQPPGKSLITATLVAGTWFSRPASYKTDMRCGGT